MGLASIFVIDSNPIIRCLPIFVKTDSQIIMSHLSAATTFFLVAIMCLVSLVSCTNTPVIGVMSVPVKVGGVESYIPASYIKWVESGGARVIPIMYDTPKDELDFVFQRINGLLFIGGLIGEPSDSSRHIFQLALDANDNGDYFPVWGTCLGFEWMVQMVSCNDSIVTDSWKADNITIPLNLTSAAPKSRLFTAVGTEVEEHISTEPITANFHHMGVSPEEFEHTPLLVEFFDVLSTNLDLAGREFVSMVEGTKHPIYGVQFHPGTFFRR